MLCLSRFAAICALCLVPLSARAAGDPVTVSILPGWRMADGSYVAALKFVLEDGWKTYWRAPGDAGIPPRFDWSGSDNLAAVDITWPAPEQTRTNGLRTIGYDHDLILPLRLTPQREGEPIALSAKMEIGVCSDICVPVYLSATERLDIDGEKRDPQIAAALAARPYSAAEAGVADVRCALRPVDGGLALEAVVVMPAMGRDEWIVVETGNPDLWVAQSQTRRDGARLVAQTEIMHVDGRGFMVDRSGLRLTVLSTGDAVDIRGCAAP